MKKTFIWGLAFLFLVALFPLTSGIKEYDKRTNTELAKTNAVSSNSSSRDEYENNAEPTIKEIEIIVCKVMEHITEDAHAETKKALLAVCKNNYLYLKKQGFTDFEAEISKYSDSFFEELCSLYKESEYKILLDGKSVPIPLTEQNGGFTATNDEYPYILRVASPWDTFSENYVRGAEYAGGISIYGISYLCENGMKWNEALKWYMPNFEIKA